VPRAILVAFAIQLAILPATNAIARRYEAEADWLGIRATHDPASARALFRRFARLGLEDPTPPGWVHVWLDDHPTPLQRVEMTEAALALPRSGRGPLRVCLRRPLDTIERDRGSRGLM
jgi:STE24 endopeptidase